MAKSSAELNAIHPDTVMGGRDSDARDGLADIPAKDKSHPRRFRLRKVSYLIHSFVGLKLTILLSIVFLTGTLAVLNEEIDWLIYPEMRVSPQGEKLNPGEVLDRATAQVAESGEGTLSWMYSPLEAEYTASFTTLNLPGGGERRLYIDPYTGELNGTSSQLTVGGFLSRLHTTLYLPLIGRMFVNFFGILCIISIITGVINYPKFWRYFFRKPRFEKSLRTWMGDIHRLLALWSLWFVLIMGVTGTWWFYQYPLVHYELAPQFLPESQIQPGPSHEDLNALNGKPKRLSSKEIVEKVLAVDPNYEITYLSPPEHNGMAYTLWGTHRDALTAVWGSNYYVHPFSGDILGEKPTRDLSLIQRTDMAMYPLHYGTWGNSGWQDLTVKLVWFFFGLAMTALAISGVVIYYKRTRAATEKLLPPKGRLRQMMIGWRVLRPWGGPMSGFKYLNWVAIWFIALGLMASLTLTSQGASGSGYKYTTQQVGDWTVSMNAIKGFFEADLDPIVPGWKTNIYASLEDGDPDGIKFMYVKINKPRTTRAPGMVIHGPVGSQHAHVEVPEKLKENAELWLTIEDWDGNFHQTSWPLMPDGRLTIDTRAKQGNKIAALSEDSDG